MTTHSDHNRQPISLQSLKIKWFLTVSFVLLFCSAHAQTAEKGYAKVYPTSFHGRKTASKQTYDKNKYTAAHKTLPFGTSIAVVNLQNNKKVTVTVNDRGPYVKGSVIELSSKAAKMLQISKDQKVQVEIRILDRSNTIESKKDKTIDQKETISNGVSIDKAIQQYENGGLYKMQVLPVEKKGFGVQVASYSDYEAVLKQITALQDNWFKGSMVYVDQIGEKKIYKVILGPLFNRDEAASYCKNIQSKYKINDAFVVDLSTLKK